MRYKNTNALPVKEQEAEKTAAYIDCEKCYHYPACKGDTDRHNYFGECRHYKPAADVVEVRHAYWEETTHITESKRGREIHSTLYDCSYCHAPNGRRKDLFCRWCGAKMDGERKKK